MERACRLSNTTYWEITPSLPLPSLPVSCGARSQRLQLSEETAEGVARSIDRNEVLGNAGKIADLLRDCDVSYLNVKDEPEQRRTNFAECPRLYSEVLRYNSAAFDCTPRGAAKKIKYKDSIPEEKPIENNGFSIALPEKNKEENVNNQLQSSLVKDPATGAGFRKPKIRKKESLPLPTNEETDHQEIVRGFCEVVEDFCGRAEVPISHVGLGIEESSLSLNDIKYILKEVNDIREKKLLNVVPVDLLTRLLDVLDHQIKCGQGLSFDELGDKNVDAASLVFCALESAHVALAVMAHPSMPKQLYKDEMIERILDFSRHQIMEVMAAFDPSYRAIQKPSESVAPDGDDDEEDVADLGSAGKRRRNTRLAKVKKASGNKISKMVLSVLQKLCSILGFLKDLLTIERLSDGCILQLMRTCFSTFLVDDVQILQLKAITLICTVFGSYAQHQNFVMDEILQLLRKLPSSKRAMRTYFLPEEQKQIQMITALLIHLVQCCADLPKFLTSKLTYNSIQDVSINVDFPIKCHEAATEACCLFWTNVLQRLTTAKAQDVAESKMMLENIVMDLLTTLNLPEYPASASILEVLCVLLLQNAGLKSKDISARCMAVDLLGTIAARLKNDAVTCNKDKFWIVQELFAEAKYNATEEMKDSCCVCCEGRGGKAIIVCHSCQRCFHIECLGFTGGELLHRDWSCHICLCRKQLSVLQSSVMSNSRNDSNNNACMADNPNKSPYKISSLEVIQQMLINYLQENASSDDLNLFTRWFYLCLWYKDDSDCQDKIIYYVSRVKSKTILRDFGFSLLLSREWAKKISLALGQLNSFSRGFDKILSLLLASLRENSPVLRAKALRSVSAIVEADPEVLCDKRVQIAVEGRFCDSAISVREAALELVGRHISTHPEVSFKYFEKVSERIKDTGVSVRKRAIKIIRDMCISNANFSEMTRAFLEIISRVSDDESSIQDLVGKTFYEFWFEEPMGTQTQFSRDGSSVPLELARKTEQMVNLLRKMPNHQPLVTVIRRNLTMDFLPQSAKASGINAGLSAQVRRRSELMCKHLLERILQLEETTNVGVELVTLPYVVALQAFCVVDPSLCAPATDPSQFVVTLQPYLKSQADTRPVAQLVESIIFIIDAVLPLLRKPSPTLVEELEQDLKQMIVRHSFLSVVHSCIKCLCSLSEIAGKGASLIEYLIQVFFKHLYGAGMDNKQLLGRSLFCLGLLVRYGKELMNNLDNRLALVTKSHTLLQKFLVSDDFALRVRSLQALGFLLIAQPEYMLDLDIRKIIEASLSSTSDVRIKMQALQNMNEYLLDAESQMGKDGPPKPEVSAPEDSVNKVPVAAGAGDTNICGGIIQLYWDNILELSIDSNEQVRQSALKIVEIVLRQGLVHPITCVPYLVALETDPQEANSKLAHHLLIFMNEKYPAFFENRLGDGLQMSFNFVQSLLAMTNGDTKGKQDVSAFSWVRPGISRIYRLIRVNRISRNKFMHSIVRKFEPGGWSSSSLSFLVYCAEILATLPFASPDEPLYLIYDINRVLQLRAGPLESNMKAWSSILQQKDLKDITNRKHGLEDGSGGDDSVVSEETLLKCQVECRDAIALQLLLKLKKHLKVAFSLDNARCQAFSLKEYPKHGETLSRQNIPFVAGDSLARLPQSPRSMVQKYQELKNLLREDAVDYVVYSGSAKKRSAQKSARGKLSREERNEGEDEYGDEEWPGGHSRNLGFGGLTPGKASDPRF
ncbi:PHD finger family protein [Wolffia australiana]